MMIFLEEAGRTLASIRLHTPKGATWTAWWKKKYAFSNHDANMMKKLEIQS